MGGAAGEAELAPEEFEKVGVSEPEPGALAVEVGEGDEKVGERGVLAAEEIGEAAGGFAWVVHGEIVSRVFAASWNARRGALGRGREAGVAGAAAGGMRRAAGVCGGERGGPRGAVGADPERRGIVSTDSG